MLCFGFGYRGFGQPAEDLLASLPQQVRLQGAEHGDARISRASPSWSYTAFLTEDGSIVLSGFVGGSHVQYLCIRGLNCLDILPSEKYLILLFADRVGCWDITTLGIQEDPIWKMDLPADHRAGNNAEFPLVANGHVLSQAPFFRELPAKCHAHKLALGNEHAVLLTSDGTILTWGAGRHGQLGHGDLEDVSEPRILEALHGVVITQVGAGGWHSGSISEGGDIYCWGWNESGQLGLPSKSLAQERTSSVKSSTEGGVAEPEEFITMQAFPALIDLPHDSEASRISCGSRHTAVVTCKYGQLGHGDTKNLDHPKLVEYFSQHQLCVKEVSCRHWKTYVLCHQQS